MNIIRISNYKEIKDIVEKATQIATNGKDIANSMIDGYHKLNEDINKNVVLINGIQSLSKEQLLGIEQINNAINSLDKQTQENANVATQTQEIALSTDKISKLIVEDANNKDYSIGAQTGSIQLDLANENTPDADIVSLPKVTDIITELLTGKMDGAFIETAVAESYQKNYPDLEIVCDVPYDTEGSAIGVAKGNEALLKAVNEAIADAIDDGSIDKFVADATELAAGQTYEGTLDDNGAVPETDDTAEDAE